MQIRKISYDAKVPRVAAEATSNTNEASPEEAENEKDPEEAKREKREKSRIAN